MYVATVQLDLKQSRSLREGSLEICDAISKALMKQVSKEANIPDEPLMVHVLLHGELSQEDKNKKITDMLPQTIVYQGR